ncbi:MAG: type II toxin-antitoxin system RelE/ParE family toxin [Flavobacteriales bacterium]|jgi:plasmid stabilization system protein ParE
MVKRATFRVIWDAEAISQFADILNYIGGQSEQAPRIVKTAVLKRVDLLRKNPFVFETDKLKDPPDESFRAFVVYSFRVAYQVRQDLKEIRVLRIRHTSREPLGY